MTYFVPKLPGSGEHGTYNRAPTCFFWTKPGPIDWAWQFQQGYTPAATQRVRLLVDGVPATDWVLPDATNLYRFSFTAADGHHLASAEAEGMTIEPLAKSFVVNTTGAPLPVQRPWAATNRFERTYIGLTLGAQQITYNGPPAPKTYPLKARVITPFSEVLPKSQMWVRRITENVSAALTRRFVSLPTGDVDIEGDQKYFYSSVTTLGPLKVGLVPPSTTCRDGPRGVGSLGPVYKIIVRSGGSGSYFMETTGRLGFLGWSGNVVTLVGWRIKPGELKAHGGIRSSEYMYGNGFVDKRPEHQAYYDSKWEHLGDWALVPGPQRFLEPWGFSMAHRRADGSIDNREGHEFWICDTLHHRIVFADHWTAHSASGFQPAEFPPVGYPQPAVPSGAATMFKWGGNDDATPSAFFNEPWDCEVNPADGKLYWTNFGSGSICRANLDGSNPEVVLQTPVNPSNAQLGVAKRLDRGNDPQVTRASWLVDGPVGTATCVRPQAMGFNSTGKLIWVERYTYAIRELDLTTGMVRTLATILDINGGSTSSGNNDAAMAIDIEGAFGPQDDIFVSCWSNNTDKRYSKDGVYRGQWAFTSGAKMTNGPLNKVDAPGYAWGVGVGGGRLLFVGNAAGWQCIEVTKRLPGDPEPDTARIERGRAAYYKGVGPMALLHGPEGQGELGLPTIEEMGSWDDATLTAYAQSHGVSTSFIGDFVYWVRFGTVEQDYSVSNPAPSAPSKPLTLQGITHV